MTDATGERQALATLGEELGWEHRPSADHAEVFNKGTVRIRVNWAGEQISGATIFHDQMYESYTRDADTLRAWLKR